MFRFSMYAGNSWLINLWFDTWSWYSNLVWKPTNNYLMKFFDTYPEILVLKKKQQVNKSLNLSSLYLWFYKKMITVECFTELKSWVKQLETG